MLSFEVADQAAYCAYGGLGATYVPMHRFVSGLGSDYSEYQSHCSTTVNESDVTDQRSLYGAVKAYGGVLRAS